MTNEMMFTLWDVGHGLSIWIKTPSGQNHWIDAGKHVETDFCPAEHVKKYYGATTLNHLIISHPDADHLHNLPDVIEHLGKPKNLLRNKTLPAKEKYGEEKLEYQKVYKELDTTYTVTTPWETSPCNPDVNGGVRVKHSSLVYREGMGGNNTSIVVLYLYGGWLFVCPGDIEDDGWKELWPKAEKNFQPLLDEANYIVMVAPHHGRSSGYSEEMMETIHPHMVLISDKYGKEPTDPGFRNNPQGLGIDGVPKKFLSTKTSGRIQFVVKENGQATVD